ncbi:MAG TPA: nucleotidyltransferase domain-containing protein [Candidatus Nanoarchaeia archaeon]|nr:nucleotidyltransferase domain-containing protein [Candidatus Nanoarchaeia archaeon]
MKPNVTKRYLELFIQNSLQRVLEVLFQYPEKEFSLSDLAKEARVAKPHIGKILSKLERLGFITITKLAKIWRIKANQQSGNFIKSKIVYNLNFICQSGLVEFLTDYFGNPKAIILFGSFRQGEDFSTSDIDIAIENEETEYKTRRLRILSDYEKAIGRTIQIHLFNRRYIDTHVFNNIANGIVLSGFLEVKP